MVFGLLPPSVTLPRTLWLLHVGRQLSINTEDTECPGTDEGASTEMLSQCCVYSRSGQLLCALHGDRLHVRGLSTEL